VVCETLGDLDAGALADVIVRSLEEPTPARRSQAALRGFFGDRREALARRMAELRERRFDRVVICEHLLFPGAGPETTVVFHTPGPRETFVALNHLPCRRIAALSAVFRATGDAAIEAHWTFTGFWIRRVQGVLSDEVERFLGAGTEPFFLTMGSMVGFDAAALAGAFVAAAARAGRRAIVQRGWAGLSVPPSPDVLVVDEIDYATLFPRCAAIFTHGGTGTTALALHAGRPLAFLPLVGDQHLWARNLVPLGVGVGRLDPRAPSEEAMFLLMRRALDDATVAGKAAALARMIQAENGLARACLAIEA
jgi:UDP:flavonoid glycosyltransferase YjiC (YdhE family)